MEKTRKKASRSAYDYLYHPILKLYPLWEIVARKPDFTAVSRTYDMHRLALLIRSSAMSICLFVFKKSVLSHAMLPSEGSRLNDPNQNTHPRKSAHHDDPSKTANRSCKAARQMSATFFKVGEKS